MAPAQPGDAFGGPPLDRPCGPDPRARDAAEGRTGYTRSPAPRPAVPRPTVPRPPEAAAAARGYLGLRLSEVSEVRWSGRGRVVRYCAYPLVVSVEPASPAERAGVGAGDTLVALGTRDLVRDGPVALDRLLVPGAPLRVRLRRDGRAVTRTLVVGLPPVARGGGLGPVPGWAPAAAGPRDRVVRVRVFTRGEIAVGLTDGSGGTGDPGLLVDRTPADDADGRRAGAADPAWIPQLRLLPRPGAAGWVRAFGPAALAGAQLVALDDDLREAVAGAPERGVFVLKVLPGTPASDAGLRAGDVVVEAGGRAVWSTAAVQRALARGGGEVVLRVERGGVARRVVLRW